VVVRYDGVSGVGQIAGCILVEKPAGALSTGLSVGQRERKHVLHNL
jgi:hypothetical protein